MNKRVVAVAGFIVMFSLVPVSHAEKRLNGDEIKALITGKTIYVSYGSNKWRQYHAADGSTTRDNGEISDWSVKGDEHCNTAATKFPCAPIRDNGDGTYARLKPDGGVAVTWTKIVDGKEF